MSDRGYTLTSELTVDDEPFSMRFGEGAVPAPKKETQLLIYDPEVDADAEVREALNKAKQQNTHHPAVGIQRVYSLLQTT